MRSLSLSATSASAKKTVAAIMSTPLEAIGEDAFVYQAIARVTRKDFRYLAVANAAGEIVGALTTGDLLRQRAHDALI